MYKVNSAGMEKHYTIQDKSYIIHMFLHPCFEGGEVGSEMQNIIYSAFHILRFAYCENINLFCIFVETGEYESIPDKRLSRFTLFLRQEK
jgi:hypothetical protein